MNKKLFLLVVLIIPFSIFATEKFPHLCRVSGLRYEHRSILFFSQHTAKPRLYVINNTSAHPIWLVHEDKHPSASAGWSSRLFPKKWTAILVSRRNFSLVCQIQKKSGVMVTQVCRHLIRVCQYSHFYSKNSVIGGYWVAENLPLHALETRIRARGFLLSDHTSLDKK